MYGYNAFYHSSTSICCKLMHCLYNSTLTFNANAPYWNALEFSHLASILLWDIIVKWKNHIHTSIQVISLFSFQRKKYVGLISQCIFNETWVASLGQNDTKMQEVFFPRTCIKAYGFKKLNLPLLSSPTVFSSSLRYMHATQCEAMGKKTICDVTTPFTLLKSVFDRLESIKERKIWSL